MSKEEIEKPEERQRWMGRFTFILAAIGSAIGLGNFWRFPYLTYKHGGAQFFFPWAMCLFIMGIPFMIMELALGQKFQRGDISVFKGIDRRLMGIGVISVYSSYVFSWYYNVIVAWALVYVVVSFKDPLPWSTSIPDTDFSCPVDSMSRAEQFYRINVIRFVDSDTCLPFEDGNATVFSWPATVACLSTWIIIFLCVFKGVKSSSYIVWITVPLPVLFVFIMIFNGASLDGASDGVERYFRGITDPEKQTNMAEQWSDAAGQIFLGLSVCLGIMTSYGSYNPVNKPIIMDSVVISVSNCSFSFIAGFAVWTVVGYLAKLGQLDESKTAGIGLAFFTYPTAIDTMSASNFWAFVLGLTLFLLGLDSSFSAIEATSTVICDTAWKGKAPRMFIAFVLCLVGFLGSLPFCCNWGFILFDVVDHYLCAYLLLLIGILQAFGCGWFFDLKQTMAKSEGHTTGLKILSFGYWIPLVIIVIITTILDSQKWGFLAFALVLIVVLIVSWKQSGLGMRQWYEEVVMCGVRKIAYSCSQVGRVDPLVKLWWEPVFALYWGLCIKYISPCVLSFMIIGILKNDIKKPYEGYSQGWQVIGWLIPALGIVLYLVTFLPYFQDDTDSIPLDYTWFELYEENNGKTHVGPDGMKKKAINGNGVGPDPNAKANKDEVEMGKIAEQPKPETVMQPDEQPKPEAENEEPKPEDEAPMEAV